MINARLVTSHHPEICHGFLEQCFSTFPVKWNPLQQFWLFMEPMSFWGDSWARRAKIWDQKPRAGEELLGRGQQAPSPLARGSRGAPQAPPVGFGMEPQPQVHFGPTKSLENASSGCKCWIQFNFFTVHRQSRGTLVEKHCSRGS